MEDLGREARRRLQNQTTRIPFANKILCVGCGGVAQCMLPVLPSLVDVPLSNITVIDMVDNRHKIKDMIDRGVKYFVEKIDQQNFESILTKYTSRGDILIDLSYEIATIDYLKWCHDREILYVNASVEVWDPYMNPQTEDARKFTLYSRHTAIQELKKQWGDKGESGPTAVLDHGANPGLVSHFVKLGLEHIADRVIADHAQSSSASLPKSSPSSTVERIERIKTYKKEQKWNLLSMELGVKVIHVSERDTQTAEIPKKVGEFVNTWSPEGFYEEGVAPAEIGWGTHERTLPPNALEHLDGPKNQILLKSKGMNTLVRSWVPMPEPFSGDILGFVVRHGEAYTISNHLTVRNEHGEAVYRPTVHYAYRPCDSAANSIDEIRMCHYRMHKEQRVLSDEITSGQDILGCLLMGHDYKSWWIGSLLGIEEARELVPHQNATTVQVAISVASAVHWMIANPRKGICVPDDLPHHEILERCWPWLGPCISKAVDWSPIEGITSEKPFEYERNPVPSNDDMWQFSSFLVHSF